MSRNNPRLKPSTAGFTLVEMLIVAPLALLVIAGFIALMVTMVGDAIANHNRNVMTYDIQNALNMVEQDTRLSSQFLTTSGVLPSPQGKDGATAAFSSTAGDLILGEAATNKNPIDPTRGFVYYNAPFSCSDPAQVFKNQIFFNTVVYFTRSGSLWRRTYVPSPSGTPCTTPWQVNSCAPGYTNTTQCKTTDSEIMQNVDSFAVNYYTNPQDTSDIGASNATTASTIKVTINGRQSAAGRSFTASAATRVSKLSSRDIATGPPATPTVSSSVTGTKATFTWAAVPNTTSYIVTYNVNGGSWITASDNTTETSFAVTGFRGDTITVKVLARNNVGTSADGASNNKSATIPQWIDCTLSNSWINYAGGYDTCGYTITKAGIVMFKGHIKSGTTGTDIDLFQLPDELRPSTNLMFQVVANPNTSTRLDVRSDGWVRLPSIASNNYVGLDGVYFVPKYTNYSWNTLSLLNSWTTATTPSGFSPLQSTIDYNGRVHTRGLIKQGTFTTDTQIAQLPAGSQPTEYYHFPARGDAFNTMGVNSSGYIVARGISSTYYSAQAMFYPSGYGSWQSFTGAVASDPADNQLGNNWVSYNLSPQPTPQYTKSADGIVTLKGLLKKSTAGVDKEKMARLPAGYCPRNEMTLAFSTVGYNNAVARIDVARISSSTSCALVYRSGSNTWMSLDNISYLAEP